ncbi:helix-turn-helix domain-containing protein [Tunturiibacter gelidiferens]|uniref:helix-turn-helix domain-containing protein n=1 Tax=Tunturiibacter gelidiferens TaxID=3069689 RepID=UPI00333E272D
MDVIVAPARTSNRQGSAMNRNSSDAVLSPEPERGHAGAAEYLLELLTVDEIAAALRVSPSWVYERVRKRGRDKIPHLKIGKYLRFRLKEVRIWVDQGTSR